MSQSPAAPTAEQPYSIGGYPQYLAASWTSTNAYSDVAISFENANASGPGGGSPSPQSGTAYLMTQIGAGTTTAQEIASAPFTEPGGTGLLQVFSGLTLASGTYYLVMAGPQTTITQGAASWMGSTNAPVVQTDSGVTFASDYATSPAAFFNPAAFPPSVPFFAESLNLQFTVTGDPISGTPEPATWSLLLFAGMTLPCFRLMKRVQSRRNK